MRLIVLGALILMAACTTPEERAAKAAEYEAGENWACASYGLRFGTPEFAQCRMFREQQRMARAAALLGYMGTQRPPTPIIVVPYSGPPPIGLMGR
jgi:hypothetical protein